MLLATYNMLCCAAFIVLGPYHSAHKATWKVQFPRNAHPAGLHGEIAAAQLRSRPHPSPRCRTLLVKVALGPAVSAGSVLQARISPQTY